MEGLPISEEDFEYSGRELAESFALRHYLIGYTRTLSMLRNQQMSRQAQEQLTLANPEHREKLIKLAQLSERLGSIDAQQEQAPEWIIKEQQELIRRFSEEPNAEPTEGPHQLAPDIQSPDRGG